MKFEFAYYEICLCLEQNREVDEVLIHDETFLSLISIHGCQSFQYFTNKDAEHFVDLKEILEQ